ncbi:MAG: hypothetical protein JO306_10335, partial [Gemmatimonadetes bacterium]|nr:hypothetical protein [Gemmatimonadota bacterium]
AVGDLSFRAARAVPRLKGTLLQLPAHVQFFTAESMRRLAKGGGYAAAEVEHGGGMRTPPPPRNARVRVARALLRTVDAAAGNGNWYVWFRTPGGG